jgi:hypothetical protein
MAENWLTYLLGGPDNGKSGVPRLFDYVQRYPNLSGRNQPSPFGPGGVYGPPAGGGMWGGGGGGGGTPPVEPPPGPTPVPNWAFPDYTQDWAFTPPAPFYTAPPPVFNKKNYSSSDPSKK